MHLCPARQLPAALLVACLLALLPAGRALSQPAAQAEWTLMVYMCADNNLELQALVDLCEMEQSLPEGVEVAVLLDRSRGFAAQYGNWSGARLYRLRRPQPFDMRQASALRMGAALPPALASELLEDWGPVDMASPATLERFVKEAAARFPARRYVLVPWNHGGAWRAPLQDEDAGQGRPGKGTMSIQEFAEAARRGARSLPRGRFDIVISNMCLMAQLDIMAESASLADYAFACAPVEPGQSFDYLATLPVFGQGLGTEDILRRLVDVHQAFYRALPEEASHSAFRLAALPAATARRRALSGRLAQLAGTRFRELTRAAAYASRQGGDLMEEFFNSGRSGYFSLEIFDWLDLLEADVPDAPRAETAALRQALADVVLHTASFPEQGLSRGLTLYHPLLRAHDHPGYLQTAFARESGLAGYFEALWQAQDTLGATSPRIERIAVGIPRLKPGRGGASDADFDIVPADRLDPFTQTSVKFDVTGAGILMTRLLQYEKRGTDFFLQSLQLVADRSDRRQAGAGGVLKRISPVYPDGTTTFVREMGTVYKLTNGMESASVTISNLAVSRGRDNLSFAWGLYQSPETGGRELLVRLAFSNQTRMAKPQAQAIHTDAQGRPVGMSQIILQPSGTIRPCVEVLDSTKNFALRRVFGKPLPLSTGRLFFYLDMLDEGSEVGNFIMATTMNGRSGIGLSPALRVRQNPELAAMAAEARDRGTMALAGRYAMVRLGASAEGLQVLPSFQTLEIQPGLPLPRFVFRDAGRETGSGLCDWRPEGMPQLVLFTRPTMAHQPLGDHVETWYLFLKNHGAGRIWYGIGMGDGARWAFVPPEQYQPGLLEGVWTGPRERWEFRSGTVRLDYRGQHGTGSFTLRDNVMACTGMPSSEYAVWLDREQDRLYLMSREKRISELKREGAARPAPQPEAQPGIAAPALAGVWLSAGQPQARLVIAPVPGTPFLNVYASLQGQHLCACTTALGQNALLATCSDGWQERIPFAFSGAQLRLQSQRLPAGPFLRQQSRF